jgi:hypothetical protein
MPDPQENGDDGKIAEIDIPIEWNRITIGIVKAVIYEGDVVDICSEDADERFLIAEGEFEGTIYRVQSCFGGIDGVTKALKEEIESYLKRSW